MFCSSKGGGRKRKLSAQRRETSEEKRLCAGRSFWVGGPRRRQMPGDMRDVQGMDG